MKPSLRMDKNLNKSCENPVRAPLIAIDGSDGAGKTTLIRDLGRSFTIIHVPKFHDFGSVPRESIQRKKWFRTENPLATTAILLRMHRLRILLAMDFSNGFHYEVQAALKENHKTNQLFVVLDRGPLSVAAYGYACLKADTNLTDNKILQFINEHFGGVGFDFVMASILLNPESIIPIDDIFVRVSDCDEREKKLIYFQCQFFCEYINNFIPESNVYCIDPLTSRNKVSHKAKIFLDQLLERGTHV